MKMWHAFIILLAVSCGDTKNIQSEAHEEDVVKEREKIERLVLTFYGPDKSGTVKEYYNFNDIYSLYDVVLKLNHIDLLSVKHLTLRGDKLKIIDGIECFPNIESINLNGTKVKDIALFTELTRLIKITAAYNQIKIIPDFSCLEDLEDFNVHNNPLIEFENIKKLVQCSNIQFSYYPESDKEAENKAREISDYLESLGIRCHWNGYQAQKTDD